MLPKSNRGLDGVAVMPEIDVRSSLTGSSRMFRNRSSAGMLGNAVNPLRRLAAETMARVCRVTVRGSLMLPAQLVRQVQLLLRQTSLLGSAFPEKPIDAPP